MASNETEIEAEIQAKGLTAPRITPADIDALIMDEWFTVPPGTRHTICVLTLRNGFTVSGESAAVSSENFDPNIGMKTARDNARNKIWPLAGYHLRTMLDETMPAQLGGVAWAGQTAAVLAHEVNRIWCRMNGDFSQPAWDNAPKWQQESVLDGVVFHIDNPAAGPEASHENWRKRKAADGWTYGPVKDPEKKEHPCMVPFAELPEHQQIKDRLFRAVVHAVVGDGLAT